MLAANGVAFTCRFFEPRSIDDGDPSTLIRYQTGVLQLTRRKVDAGPLRPKHLAQEVLRQVARYAEDAAQYDDMIVIAAQSR